MVFFDILDGPRGQQMTNDL